VFLVFLDAALVATCDDELDVAEILVLGLLEFLAEQREGVDRQCDILLTFVTIQRHEEGVLLQPAILLRKLQRRQLLELSEIDGRVENLSCVGCMYHWLAGGPFRVDGEGVGHDITSELAVDEYQIGEEHANLLHRVEDKPVSLL
jgi:hypothetical protein